MTGILNLLAGSISSAIKDGYFNLVTLLLPGNGTNGAQNNTFLDSSTNNFTITRNGNTTQGTFSPFSQTGWSNYFDGTGDYLSVANNAAFQLGSGNWTIECWVYLTATSTTNGIYAKRANAGFGDIAIAINGSNLQITGSTSGSAWAFTDSTIATGISLNTWTHIAIVRNSTSITGYVNGVAGGTPQSVSGSLYDSGQASTIGSSNAGASQFINGYISNFRFNKGTAVYTSNFTPSTTPLTDISGTSLLTCQSNRFIDNSSNAFSITRNGDTSVQAFSPFAPTAAYDATTNGGSGYFDGAGDVLTVASNTAFDFAGNATIELWIYFTANMGARQDIVHHATNGFEILKLAGDTIYCGFGGGTITSSSTVKSGQWYHIAIVRSSTGASGLNMYINGVNVGSATAASSVTSGTMAIGAQASGTNPVSGYISGYRIVKGTAVYTAAFTPPTAPLTAISGTSLLLSCTNAGITDATAKNDLETVGNAQISTTQSKFGGSSMYFDGTGDYLQIPDTNLFPSGTENFTIEFWAYFSGTGTMYLAGQCDSSGTVSSQSITILKTSGEKLQFYCVNSSTQYTCTSTNNLPQTTWTHIACVRNGSTLTQYINGTADGTATISTNAINNSSNRFGVGTLGEITTNTMNGYIDDFRITKGYARYTANFTPPTAAFALQ